MNEVREAMIAAGYYDDVEEKELELEPDSDGEAECPLCPIRVPFNQVPTHIRQAHD